MLTFSFTGVEGSMTESEILTSGMVGKEILLSFDESWSGLTKTLVFRAGEVTRVVLDPGTAVTVPADVLKRPFHKLYVGVYGTDAEGTLVIPTVMAEGPMIRYGADPIEDETAEELPVWQNLQNQIGLITGMETTAKANLVAAINELHRRLNVLEETAPKAPVAYWDFRTSGLTDRVAGLEAVATEDVTFDSAGAHLTTSASYLTVPLGTDGATLAGNYIEVKFGEMELTDTGTTMRLLTGNNGSQPATNGLMWTSRDCWTNKLTTTTDLTDMQMFSGQTVIGRPNEDETQIHWYLGDQYLVPSDPPSAPTHVSVGASVNSAYPITVEYIKIRPLE